MIQDKVRTSTYAHFILTNSTLFRDAVVFDVGCARLPVVLSRDRVTVNMDPLGNSYFDLGPGTPFYCLENNLMTWEVIQLETSTLQSKQKKKQKMFFDSES